MLIQLTTTQWLALPAPVKARLKEVFHIKRSEGTHMIDSRVLSDGHTHNDLLAISVAAMQEYTGEKKITEFYALFEKVLAQVEAELAPTTKAAVTENTVVVLAKPTEELTIEHNGKTYKLTEVAPASVPQVAPNAPLYGTPPATSIIPAGTDQVTGKAVVKRGRKPGTKNKAK